MKLIDSIQKADADPVLSAMAVVTFAMAALAVTRSSDTEKHILRTQHYVKILAERLQSHPSFASVLTAAYIGDLFQAVSLHDMGTIGIPDRILLKPSRLTPAEFKIIETHTTLAHGAIENAEKNLGCRADLLQTVKEIVFSHHEKWDGSGYPQGLSENQIPVSARLTAIADVYDALISDRVYRPGMHHEQAVGIIFQGRASHFDPDMVDAFIEVQDDFNAVAQRYADTDVDMQKKIEYMANAIAETAEF